MKTKFAFRQPALSPLLIAAAAALIGPAGASGGPFQATGFKTGETTHESTIVWTRLTQHEQQHPADAPMFEIKFAKPDASKKKKNWSQVYEVSFPADTTAADIAFAAPGAEGETRVRYRPEGVDAWEESAWAAVDPDADYTRQHQLEHLEANTRYEVVVEARGAGGGPEGASLEGGFRTAPAPDEAAPVSFVVTTGQAFRDRDSDDGYVAYDGMLALDPSFFVHTGDIVYYDRLAKTVPLAHWHWQRTYGLPSNLRFHKQVTSYFVKDDHDAWTNDCWPGMKSNMFQFTFEDGLRIFPQQVPMGESTYRTIRWGKDLQVWFVEGRDFRSPNDMPDGPDKTIWGAEQKAWFQDTVAASDATFRVLVSPTPIVGPDRDSKHDNHSNQDFTHEGDEIRAFIASQKDLFVVCGDRHWQYHSVHPESGVREYSCGPISEAHAGGWSQKDYRDDYHRYLNVRGGFLSVSVERVDGAPQIAFRFHDPEAKEVLFEDVHSAGE